MKHHPSDTHNDTAIEARLKQLQPQPCRMSATDLLRTATQRITSDSKSVVQTSRLHWVYFAATGLGGIAVGAFLAALFFLLTERDSAKSNVVEVAPQANVVQQPFGPKRETENSIVPTKKNQTKETWSRNELIVARHLEAMDDSLAAMPPLSASSLVWPREYLVQADDETFVSESMATESDDETSTRTIGASDAKFLLNDIFGI